MSRLTRLIRSLPSFPEAAWENRLLPLQQPGFPVAVCWSAKSGCTTILKWFLAQTGRLDEALAHSRWVHDYRENKLFPARDYLRQCDRLFGRDRHDVSVVKVIRDPATRAVSSFLHFLRWSRSTSFRTTVAEVNRWKSAAGHGNQPGLSFRQFLMFVAARQGHRPALDIHMRPQHDAKQDPRVDTYIRLEDLATGLRFIEDRHGLPHVDIRGMSMSGHHNPASADHAWPALAAAFTADHDTLDDRGTPAAEVFLDPETRALIRDVYRIDYESYGRFYELRLDPAEVAGRPPTTRPKSPCSWADSGRNRARLVWRHRPRSGTTPPFPDSGHQADASAETTLGGDRPRQALRAWPAPAAARHP